MALRDMNRLWLCCPDLLIIYPLLRSQHLIRRAHTHIYVRYLECTKLVTAAIRERQLPRANTFAKRHWGMICQYILRTDPLFALTAEVETAGRHLEALRHGL